jgi:predicted CXXCH cytochrome family protein
VAKATAAGYPLQGTRQQICSQCHADEVTAVMTNHAHGSNDQSSCDKCHNPHAAHEKNLLAANQAELCTRCHNPNAAVEHPAKNPHVGLQCTTCHAPHGSANPKYLKQPSLDLCVQCHSREHHVSHPMGEKTVDPIHGGQVQCTSCHILHGAEFEPLLPVDGKRDLCVRCHRDK